jgi:hypothetical protein
MVRRYLCKGELVAGSCVRCGGLACPTCDRCEGCHNVICPRCERHGPSFEYPGVAYRHPHNRPGMPLRPAFGRSAS